MNTFTKMIDKYSYYKFQVFIQDGSNQNKKTVGMAFMKDEQNSYCLKLWSFMNERFYIVPKNGSAKDFFIMTREINKLPNPKTKFHWNIIGNASATQDQLHLELKFDLFDKAVFMNLIPETPGNYDLAQNGIVA